MSEDSGKLGQLHEETLEKVKAYYGEVLQTSQDLKTSACCPVEGLPPYLAAILQQLHPEVRDRFYGCGSPIPLALEGCTVLDLGCGSGRDCYLLSKLVGPEGRVVGVDMTDSQLAVARRHRSYHAEAFGHSGSNVEFLQGYIEDLAGLGIRDDSIDVVVSNCVLNLSPDKSRAFAEVFRVLKPGGELHFADVFAGRRVPTQLARDPVLLGECLGGALYIEDFRRLLARLGCADLRTVAHTPIQLQASELMDKVGGIDFYSMTVRAFKLELEDRCEDYGQVAYYRGTIPECPHSFTLDDHHTLETRRPLLVCGNTADMLTRTRFAPHFEVIGDKSVHYGLFDCSPAQAATPVGRSGACC